jgi:hypothetical protein
MTPPPDKTLEELASKLRSPGCAADFLDLIEYLRRKANNPQDYIPEAVADAKHDLELLSATADLRAEVERLRRNAIVSHLMQGELETQLATEREKSAQLERIVVRKKCGCLSMDCTVHGAYICEDLEKFLALTTPPSATEGQT